MSRTLIEALLTQLDTAFEGDPEHSLLANLRNVGDDDWTALPEGGGRTIASIAQHAGLAPWVYADFAFGSDRRQWDEREAEATAQAASRSMAETVEWMREGHRRFVTALADLDDANLDELRPVHWGEQRPLREITAILIAHAPYHAGEINHARSLIQGTDRWDFYA